MLAGALRQLRWALRYLTASEAHVDRACAKPPRRPAAALMALAFGFGLLQVGLWDMTFHLTWPGRLDWQVPSAVCAAAMVLLLHRQAALALIDTAAARGPRAIRWFALAGLTVAVGLLLYHALRRSDPDWPTHLPAGWTWLWPRALHRALLLAPVWGAWAMLILGRFHRAGDRTDRPTRRLAENVSPVAAAVGLAVPLAGSLIYLNFAYPWHVVPPIGAVVAALGGGTALVRLRGGLGRPVLLATNFLTQLAFLVSYLIVR